jgi:hypothetical protein
MIKKLIFASVILLTSYGLSAQSVEEILEIHREVMGFENWASVSTIVLEGKTGLGGFELPYTTYINGPLMRNEMSMRQMSMVQIFDGETAYMNDPTGGGEITELPPAVVTAMQNRIDFGLDLLKVPGTDYLTLAGIEKMDGLDVFKLVFDSPVNPLTEFYVDTESYVLVRKRVIREWDGEKTINSTTYSDFKMINGMLIAHSRETAIEGDAVERRRGAAGQGGGNWSGGGGFGGGGGGGGAVMMRAGPGGGGGGGGMAGMAAGMLSRPGKDLITKITFNEKMDGSIFTKASIGGKK